VLRAPGRVVSGAFDFDNAKVGDDDRPFLCLSPATLNDHEGVTFAEHGFVNMVSPRFSFVSS
jgi:hypothetical protein